MKLKAWQQVVVYGVLVAISISTLLPFLWMVLTSFKPESEVNELNPIPKNWQFGNYAEVMKQAPFFGRYYVNSLFIASWVTFLTVLTSAMAAYAFARLRWPGRNAVFTLYLATMMIPGVVTMIPNFQIMVDLRLLDTYTGLIVPASFSAFGTFMLRQFMLSIPRALDEASVLDGASAWRVFLDVILPLARPGLITLGIFTFLGNYGSLFWPLIMVKSESMRTLPIGLISFDSLYNKATHLMMAASVMSLVPPLLLFLVGQKYLVKGIQLGAVKG
ncbi:carbohydrate ABC transporter permease [bacterium]|nr:MAG: carbohydrate ABC transporter permease [bacterium]